jgi:hypothetical protein
MSNYAVVRINTGTALARWSKLLVHQKFMAAASQWARAGAQGGSCQSLVLG